MRAHEQVLGRARGEQVLAGCQAAEPGCRSGRCEGQAKGSCPYMHDAARVAVCPRWLAGGCGLRDCPLQHAARPELMPVCTFFQQVCGALSVGRAALRMHVNGGPVLRQACIINTWAGGGREVA